MQQILTHTSLSKKNKQGETGLILTGEGFLLVRI